MALLDTNEILQLNNKINAFVLIKPNQVDNHDVDLFVVQPPPSERDPAHRAPVQAATHICDACRSALEYFSFFDALQSKDRDAAEKLPPACLLHAGAKTLQDGDDAGCHLCVLLMANLRVKRLAMRSIDQSSIEMCWQSDSSKPGARQLHFALTHRGHPRSSNNYWNLLRLRLWPSSEFDISLLGGEGELERHSNTGSVQSRETALQWLARCQANQDGLHDQCNRLAGPARAPGEEAGWLPTRLLDVSSAVETSTVKLVTPASNPEAFAPDDRQYLTLSHCWGAWGGAELPVLTTQNLEERLTEGLPVSLLPQTFQDAVEVAHWFKVRWLWIDSLCILQDSDEDWRREAVMMYDVYKNALLNISANDSPDARWGCFRERQPLAVIPMHLQFPHLGGQLDKGHAGPCDNFLLIPDTYAVFDSVNAAPLAKRGWVFQERQLSRRVLHFTSSELIWECCAKAPYAATETFPGGTPFETAFNGKPKFQNQTDLAAIGGSADKLYATWYALCEEYSAKVFSHVRDKLVALSGLAQEFELAFPDDMYMAGMWRSTLPASLLWESSSSSSRLQTPDYIAPSWSWASIGGPIVSPSGPGPCEYSLVDVLNVTTDPVIPSKPTALLKGASIRLRCFLRPVEVRPDYEKKPWYMLAMGGGKKHLLLVKEDSDDDGRETVPPRIIDNFHSDAFHYSFDVESDDTLGPESVSGYFLPLLMSQPDESSPLALSGLLVEPALGEDGSTYRRVGVLRVFGLHCLRIKYKPWNKGLAESSWDDVEELLKPTHESLRKQKESVDSSDDESYDESETEKIEADNEGQTAGKLPDGDELLAEEAEQDGQDTSEKPREPVVNHGRGGERAMEQLRVGVGLNEIDALERLYALDKAALEGSGHEDEFERLVSREITLI